MRSLIAQGQLGPPTPSPPSKIADPDTLQSARVEYVPISRHDFLRFPRSRYTSLRSSLHNSLCNYLERPIAGGYAIYLSNTECDIENKLTLYKKAAIILNILF